MDEDKKQIHCGKPNCEAENCVCITQDHTGTDEFFKAWTESLEKLDQPTCNITNQDDCENCGS